MPRMWKKHYGNIKALEITLKNILKVAEYWKVSEDKICCNGVKYCNLNFFITFDQKTVIALMNDKKNATKRKKCRKKFRNLIKIH